jgi:hypothetical protein
MKPVKEIEAEILAILKKEMKDNLEAPVKVNVVGLGPAYVVTFDDGSRLLSDLLAADIREKTFPTIQQMWT